MKNEKVALHQLYFLVDSLRKDENIKKDFDILDYDEFTNKIETKLTPTMYKYLIKILPKINRVEIDKTMMYNFLKKVGLKRK